MRVLIDCLISSLMYCHKRGREQIQGFFSLAVVQIVYTTMLIYILLCLFHTENNDIFVYKVSFEILIDIFR